MMETQLLNEAIRLRKEIAREDLAFFCGYYLHNHFTEGFARFQREWHKIIESSNKVAILAPRGHGKTTFMLGYILWNILFKKQRYIVIFSDTDTQSRILLEAIVFELEKNLKILQDFGDITGITPRRAEDKEKWTGKEIITTTLVKIQALSMKTKIRGLKYLEFRPGLVVLDDIESDEGVRSKIQREQLKSKFLRAILSLGNERSKYIIIGTMLHRDSLLANIVNGDVQGWYAKVYRAIENGVPLWHERFTTERLEQVKREIGSKAFEQEYMNEPIDIAERLYSSLVFDSEAPITYTTTALYFDLAISTAETADYTAFCYAGRDKDGKIHLLKTGRAKLTGTDLLDFVIQTYVLNHPDRVGIESNQFQKFFQQTISNPKLTGGVNIPAVGIQNTTDKVTRFLKITPYIENGTVLFQKGMNDLIDEMDGFPNDTHDDMVDAMCGACEMLIQKNPDPVYLIVD